MHRIEYWMMRQNEKHGYNAEVRTREHLHTARGGLIPFALYSER